MVSQRTGHARLRRRGFTIVELLIVMTALIVIAGIVIPEIGSVLEEATESRMLANQHDLHVAIERYRMDHLGVLPTSEAQLVGQTDLSGAVGTGPACRFGPYLPEIPVNTINNTATIRFTTEPSPDVSSSTGWIMNTVTGQIWGGLQR